MASSTERRGWRIGVDIGGTFTDVVLWNYAGGALRRDKLLTTPADPSRAVVDGIGRILAREGLRPIDLTSVIHGTTLVANALIERRGVKTGLVTTAGFRDVLEIGREWRYDLYDLNITMPTPLVPRDRRTEVVERVSASGDVLTQLDEDSVVAAAKTLRESGAEAVAVALLHSYRKPAHERRVGEILAGELPGVDITLSSDVSPELG